MSAIRPGAPVAAPTQEKQSRQQRMIDAMQRFYALHGDDWSDVAVTVTDACASVRQHGRLPDAMRSTGRY